MIKNAPYKWAFVTILLALALYVVATMPTNFGTDLKGGSVLHYKLGDASQIDDTIAVMQQRVDGLGIKEMEWSSFGKDEIKIQIPGVDQAEVEYIKSTITQLGKLEWAVVATPSEMQDAQIDVEAERKAREDQEKKVADSEKEGIKVFPYEGPRDKGFAWYYFDSDEGAGPTDGLYVKSTEENRIDGSMLESIGEGQGQFGDRTVRFTLTPAGRQKFADLTEKYVGRQMAIILNGKVHSAPRINSRIDGDGHIEGGPQGFGEQELKSLIATLKAGSLKTDVTLESQDVLGPTLGAESIDRGYLAVGLGAALVVLFMQTYYLLGGLIANIALILNLVFIMATLKLFGGTLTLPGIAGIILTVGMAVDTNILILERIREEKAKGKTLLQAVSNGYDRVFTTVFDANLTTLITAFILYWVGTGPLRGFAVTLTMGIIWSMFTGLWLTKLITGTLVKNGKIKSLKMLELFKVPRIEFSKYAKPCMTLSIVLILGGVGFFIARDPKEKYDLDFAGGALVRINLKEEVETKEVQRRLDPAYPEAVVLTIGVGGSLPEEKSTEFELQAQAADQAEVDRFNTTVRTAFADLLVPAGIEEFKTLSPEEAAKEAPEASSPQGALSFRLNLADPAATDLVKQGLVAAGFDKVAVTPAGAEPARSFSVVGTMHSATPSASEFRRAVVDGLGRKSLALSDPTPKSDFVGPKVVKDLKGKAILATILSLALILIYVRFRFKEYAFGIGAVAALAHDVLVPLGLISIFDALHIVDAKLNLAMVAAFLTIVGYSINDTIVIFDRVRENRNKALGSFRQLVDESLNQTLSRTIYTSMTVFFVVVVLFAVNYGTKSVLEGFSFALILGTISGTYSTIYIACPITTWLHDRAERKKLGGSGGAAEMAKKPKPVPAT